MNRVLDWTLERAQERSTWVGAALLLSSLGVTVSPELQAAIIQVGLAVSGLVLVLIRDRSSGAADKGRAGTGQDPRHLPNASDVHPAWGGWLRQGKEKGGVPMGLTPPRLLTVIRLHVVPDRRQGRGSARPVRAPVRQHGATDIPPCQQPALSGRSFRPETVSGSRKLSPTGRPWSGAYEITSLPVLASRLVGHRRSIIEEELMPISPDANLPDVLEALLRAEAEFVQRLLEAAPLPEGSTKDPDYLELLTRYERYMPSAEVTAIARFLYMLDAYGVTDEAGVRRLITAHNERMTALLADTAYLTRMRLPKERLIEARFKKGAINHTAINFAYHRRVALDATSVGRLLVEFANRHQVAEAMNLLAQLGFFEMIEGNFHAKVFLTTGRLEAVYRDYLAQVAQGVGAALAGPEKTTETRGDDDPTA
jgi:hypothetical protein